MRITEVKIKCFGLILIGLAACYLSACGSPELRAEGGESKYYIGNSWQSEFTGYNNVEENSEGNFRWYIVDGVVDKSHEGFYEVDGLLRYYKNGKFQEDLTGFVTDATRMEAGKGELRYKVKEGVVDSAFSGFAEEDGSRLYRSGRWMNDYTGYINKDLTEGKELYIQNGIIDKEHDGLYQVDGIWSYYSHGEFQEDETTFLTSTSGPSNMDGERRYRIERGIVDVNYSGFAEENRYYKDGEWQNNYSGVVYGIINGTESNWDVINGIAICETNCYWEFISQISPVGNNKTVSFDITHDNEPDTIKTSFKNGTARVHINDKKMISIPCEDWGNGDFEWVEAYYVHISTDKEYLFLGVEDQSGYCGGVRVYEYDNMTEECVELGRVFDGVYPYECRINGVSLDAVRLSTCVQSPVVGSVGAVFEYSIREDGLDLTGGETVSINLYPTGRFNCAREIIFSASPGSDVIAFKAERESKVQLIRFRTEKNRIYGFFTQDGKSGWLLVDAPYDSAEGMKLYDSFGTTFQNIYYAD